MELEAVLLGIPESEREVPCGDLGRIVCIEWKAERLVLERTRSLFVARRHRHEVDALEADHAVTAETVSHPRGVADSFVNA